MLWKARARRRGIRHGCGMDVPIPDPVRHRWQQLLDEQLLLLPGIGDRVAALRALAAAPPLEEWMGASALAFGRQAQDVAALIRDALTDVGAAHDEARVARRLLDV